MSSQRPDLLPNFVQYNVALIPTTQVLDFTQNEKLEQLNKLLHERNSIAETQHPRFFEQEMLLRYLKANRWDIEESYSSLLATLHWRDEFDVNNLSSEEFVVEGETGKFFCEGFDNQNRPVIYLRPTQQNTTDSVQHIRFTVYSIELAIKMLPPGIEKITMVVDLRGYGFKHAVPISESRQVLNILSKHYPERLGKAIVLEAPLIFSSFYRLVSPLIDPVTRDKILFSYLLKKGETHITNLIPKENLSEELGGSSNYKFDSSIYFERAKEFFR